MFNKHVLMIRNREIQMTIFIWADMKYRPFITFSKGRGHDC